MQTVIEAAAGSGATQSLYIPLDKPSQAISLNVRKLIGRVLEGEIRVPPFQRPLRWAADDVVKLFDSILKGYPIGSLLFWKHTFEASSLHIGNAHAEVPATSDGWYIVDGQQRTTALAASLLDLDQRGDKRWTLRFDPTTNRFLSGPAEPADRGRHVPLTVLGDLRRLGKWFQKGCELDDDGQRRVEEVQQRLLDYEIPAYVTETKDADALRAVFARMNSTGVRMRADEVFQALLGAGPGDGHRPQGRLDLDRLQRACDNDGFGEPPRSEVLKAVLAMSGADPSKRLEDLADSEIAHLVSASDATEALTRTVEFLQAPVSGGAPGAGIPSYAFVPYPVAFAILARWFHLFPEPDETTRRELARWLWRGVATGVHQRAAVSAMRLQVKAIEVRDGSGQMAGSLRRLLDATGEPASREWQLDPFHAHHAASRVEMLTLLARGPRDRNGPVAWRSLLSSGDRVAREIFSSGAWRKLDEPSQMLARTAANRVLLDTQHSGLRAELRKWSWPADLELLESHLIDETSRAKAIQLRSCATGVLGSEPKSPCS